MNYIINIIKTKFLIAILSILALVFSCSEKSVERSLVYKIECEIEPNKSLYKYKGVKEEIEVKLGGFIDTNNYKSSPASILLSGKKKYGFSTSIKEVKKGQKYIASIWRKIKKKKQASNANLIIEGIPKGNLYLNKSKVISKDKNGWEQLQYTFEISEEIEELKVYAFLSGSDSAYFDDFKIELFDFVEKQEYSHLNTKEVIYRIDCQANQTDEKYHKHEHPNSGTIKVKLNGDYSFNEYHSAPSSIILSGKNKFSFDVRIDDIEADQYFRISIWRKDMNWKKANLIVEGSPKNLMYLNNPKIVEKTADGWEKLVTEVEIPPGLEELAIYTYLSTSDTAYFDDLSIELLGRKTYPKYLNLPKIHLYYSDGDMQAFEKERKVSFYDGVHFSADKWRKAILSNESKVIPIKARLKGDWLDHMQGRKWSFRIKTRKGNTFRRMKTFSIQNPSTRYFLHEYLSHKLFAQEDILTTRYDFSPVYLNKESLGLYAIEEHFAKQLIEYNLRREGPILKLDEDPLWKSNSLSSGVERIPWRYTPNFDVSRILPFDKGSIQDNPLLYEQFQIAHSLLYQLKNRTVRIEEIIDIDKFAKYYALTDLINGKHGLTWHNQRFYYNPVNCKIEPINFDNFTEYYEEEKYPTPLIAKLDESLTNKKYLNFNLYLFSSKEFVKKYISYLEKYIDEDFTKSFYKTQEEAINHWLPIIQKEFPDYHIDYSYYQTNIDVLKKFIPLLKKKLSSGFYDSIQVYDIQREVASDYQSKTLPYFVNAYYSPKGNGAELLLENYTNRTIKIKGLLDKKDKTIYYFSKAIVLGPNTDGYTDTTISLPFFKKAEKIVVADIEENENLISELTLWPKNTKPSPYQKLLRESNYLKESLFEESNDTVYIKSGNHTLNSRVLIPKGKVLWIEGGANVDLKDSATIISYSHVLAKGSQSNPIKVYSSDKSSNGFTVLQANRKSELSHVSFSNLNTLNYEGWRLSGAVNFYESDVTLTNCSFIENHCEDALNIIRSDFYVDKAYFNKIYADAFDSDFCTGTLINSTFSEVGNDAIDFSTSQITIENCEIKNIDDKGISGGEDSKLTVVNCNIENANIGVASKDLSILKLNNVTVNNAKYGLVALQKKAEYGSAAIETKNLKLSNCETELLIEKGSLLNFNGRIIQGQKEEVAKMFY